MRPGKYVANAESSMGFIPPGAIPTNNFGCAAPAATVCGRKARIGSVWRVLHSSGGLFLCGVHNDQRSAVGAL